jgi:hypothetical protein
LLAIGFIVIWVLLLGSIVVVATLRRNRAALLCGLGAIVAWIASLALARRGSEWTDPQFGVLAVDVLLFGLLLAVGLRSTRLWPLIAAGCQFAGVALHGATFVVEGDRTPPLLVGLQLTSLAVVLVLLWGASRASHRAQDLASGPAKPSS